jgi:hypothetical protein
MPGYGLLCSPTLYAGQTVRAAVAADTSNPAPVTCRLYLRSYAADDQLERTYGPGVQLAAGDTHKFEWRIGDTAGAPIAEAGVEICSVDERTPGRSGAVYLDYLTWDGAPDIVLRRPASGGRLWLRAWVAGVDQLTFSPEATYRLVQNDGIGLAIQGTRDWTDYTVAAPVRPHLAGRAGIAARVQGMRRYYALLICADGQARLIKSLDGERVLAETPCVWELDRTYHLALTAQGTHLIATLDGIRLFEVDDAEAPLSEGAIAMVVDEGRIEVGEVVVHP